MVGASDRVLEELGFYTLAGQPDSSRDLVAEVVAGEALGLGTAFISERYNKKETAVLSGAAGAVSERITIDIELLLRDVGALNHLFCPSRAAKGNIRSGPERSAPRELG